MTLYFTTVAFGELVYFFRVSLRSIENMNRELDKLDPAEAWKPVQKLSWNLKWAAHLYRRAAFGWPPADPSHSKSSWELMQSSLKQGLEASVDELFSGTARTAHMNALFDDMGWRIADSDDRGINELQGWWLYRMLYSPHPLLERCTLFWHDHFATSNTKVDNVTLMLQQNQLLRKHALGSFRRMLLDISHDPAMLNWLDSNSNVKDHPNENYAREVMELFSLGVGNYTEKDIREATRAFTGWGTDGDKYYLDKSQHDFGSKTLLGQTGEWNGDDVVHILLEQPVAARFIVRKLYRYFVSETDDPSDELLAPLVDAFRESDYDITACLRIIFRSRLFFSKHAYRQRVKSPVDYTLGLLRSFDGRTTMTSLARYLKPLHQSLFEPPSVKDWDGRKAWLNTATLVARHNLAWRLIGGQNRQPRHRVDIPSILSRYLLNSPESQTEFLLKLIVQGDVDSVITEKLVATLNSSEDGPMREDEEARIRRKLHELAHTIALLPQFQLA